ncbi:MAG: ABC transporter permease [bacterium]
MRRKAKSLYLLTAIVIPVAILSTILLTLHNADSALSTLASKFGFTMTVQPKNIRVERIDQIGVVLDEYLSEGVIPAIVQIIRQRIRNDQEDIIIAPRLYQRMDLQHGSSAVSTIVAGIDFVAELKAKPSWRLTSGRWVEQEDEVVLGGAYAKVNHLQEEDIVSAEDRQFRVVGILQNYNAAEDYMVFIPFHVSQRILDKEGFLSLVNVQNVSLDRDQSSGTAAVQYDEICPAEEDLQVSRFHYRCDSIHKYICHLQYCH